MKDVKVGFPMGFKFNVEDNIDIDKLLQISQTYHGNKYVIGRDDNYCEKPHYHIHFFSVKETSDGAMKTFRTNVIKKTFPNINKSFRFYVGKDLPSADPNFWLAYAIKENLIKSSDLDITDDILVSAKSHLQVKQMKQVQSEKIKNKDKDKKEFKDKMFEYIRDNQQSYLDTLQESIHFDNCGKSAVEYVNRYDEMSPRLYKMMIINYLRQNDKYGSIKRCFIDQYYLEYCCRYLQYDDFQVYNMIMNK